MISKEELKEIIKVQFTSVKERGRVLAQALKVRADIAATRHRLRGVFAELGEEVFARLEKGEAQTLSEDPVLAAYRTRIRGLQLELAQRETALKEILESRKKKEESGASEGVRPEESQV